MAAKTEFEKLKAKIAKSLEAGRVVIVTDEEGISHSNVAIDIYDRFDADSFETLKIKGGSLEKWLKAAEKREEELQNELS